MKIASGWDSGDSRLPVCEQLVPRLREEGRGWLIELARWYESNWHLALNGAPKPSADSVLQLISQERQEHLRTVLELVDSRYTPLLEQAASNRSPADAADVMTLDSPAALIAPEDQPEADTVAEIQSREQTSLDGTSFSQDVDLDATLDLPSAAEPSQTLPHPTGDVVAAADQATEAGRMDPYRPNNKTRRPSFAPPEIPGYRIDRVLGRGGMGIVYLAHQEGIDRPVALKMILPRGRIEQIALDRFYAEARAVGRFQHENIVRIYDAGTHQGMPYFSLEFVEGASLADQLDGKPMEPGLAAKLLEPMARAMQVAHDDGVIHRDLKPANVLMTNDGVPKITDFGLAKELEQDQQLSQDGSVVGTPAFMSPEQARGASDVGPLTDVYGLGAVLYCLLTGRPPFQGAKPTDTLLQVIHNEPVEPIKLQPGIPKDLDTICLKCLQKDPLQRYADANALADDLGRFLRDEPILARPVGRGERVWRWCRRNPWVATASGIAAVLALVVMIGGPVTAAVIYEQKEDVTKAKDVAEQKELLAIENAAEANAARELADKHAEAASVQERNALDVLRRMTFNVQQKMRGQTNLIDLREQLIQIVDNGLEQMENNQNTARQKNMMSATIHVRLGDINQEVGRSDRALEEYQQCLAIFAELEQKDALPLPEQNWSKLYGLMGDAAVDAGKLLEAEEYFKKSLAIRRGWTKSPAAEEKLALVAESFGKLGSLQQVLGNLSDARENMEQAFGIRRLIFKASQTLGNLDQLYGAALILAKIKFQEGDTEGGLALMVDAAKRMKSLATQFPDKQSTQFNGAMFASELAVMQLYLGNNQEAEENFHYAIDGFEKLLAATPNDSHIQQELEDALYGDLVVQQNSENGQTVASTERLLTLRRQAVEQDKESLNKQTRLLNALARCGEIEEGVELALRLNETISPEDPLQYVLACSFAQLAAARLSGKNASQDDASVILSAGALKEASLKALKFSLEYGFHRPTDLRLDPDLDPVRATDEYQKLLRDVAAK